MKHTQHIQQYQCWTAPMILSRVICHKFALLPTCCPLGFVYFDCDVINKRLKVFLVKRCSFVFLFDRYFSFSALIGHSVFEFFGFLLATALFTFSIGSLIYFTNIFIGCSLILFVMVTNESLLFLSELVSIFLI